MKYWTPLWKDIATYYIIMVGDKMKNFIGAYVINNPIFWIVLIGSLLGFILFREFTHSGNF